MASEQQVFPFAPFRNSNLFSNHWLENRLPLEPDWNEQREQASRVLTRLEEIWKTQRRRVKKYGDENDRPGLALSADSVQALLDYDWPGNVRELENVIERSVVLANGPVVDRRLIPEHVRSGPSFRLPNVVVPEEGISFRDVITGFEKRLIESSLETSGGVQKKAAQLLGLKPTTLNEMIKRYHITLERKESSTTR